MCCKIHDRYDTLGCSHINPWCQSLKLSPHYNIDSIIQDFQVCDDVYARLYTNFWRSPLKLSWEPAILSLAENSCCIHVLHIELQPKYVKEHSSRCLLHVPLFIFNHVGPTTAKKFWECCDACFDDRSTIAQKGVQ